MEGEVEDDVTETVIVTAWFNKGTQYTFKLLVVESYVYELEAAVVNFKSEKHLKAFRGLELNVM